MLKHFFPILLFLFIYLPSLAQSYVPAEFRVLDIKVDVDWTENPFSEVIEWILEDVGWKVIVKWDQLEKVNVSPASLVSLRLKNVPVYAVLNECLAQLSDQITYHLTRHLIHISTKADFDKCLYTKLYPIGEFLMTPLQETAPNVDLTQMTVSPSRNFSVFPGGDVIEAHERSTEETRQGIETLVKMFKPKSWKDNGGEGTITWIGQYLVVRNIIEVHEAIAGEFSL